MLLMLMMLRGFGSESPGQRQLMLMMLGVRASFSVRGLRGFSGLRFGVQALRPETRNVRGLHDTKGLART